MLVLGIDCSTTAAKAIAWDPNGTSVAEGRSAFALANPSALAWEQDADAWWTATKRAIAECVGALGARRAEVAALSIAHQRETFVLTDATGTPIHSALVWMDARGVEHVELARQRLGEARLRELSGKPPCITPSLYKLMALFARQPELRKRRPRVLDVHGFLTWRLTGRFATSLASADPLGLVDMAARAWSPDLLGLAGLEPGDLPELVEPGAVLGALDPRVAGDVGLSPGLPLVAGAGDGQAAGLGAGIAETGRAYLNLGTAIVSGVLSREYRTSDAFRTLYGCAPGTYFLETDLKGGTFTLDWLARTLLGATDVASRLDELEREAESLPPGAEGLLLVPYFNGVMNPYWDDSASGVVIGLTGRHGPAHIYRAILEGIALEQRLHTAGVEAETGETIAQVMVMGGGSKSALWCQILADALDRPVTRAQSSEATALGAGILAAAAAGLYPDVAAATAAMTGSAESFRPGEARNAYDALYREVYASLFPTVRSTLSRLATLART
jgi:xylulokinase